MARKSHDIGYLDLPKVRVENTEHGFKCDIDGNPIDKIANVTYMQSTSEVPTFTIEIRGEPSLEVLAIPVIGFTPETVQASAHVIRNVIRTDQEMYNAFLASVKSVFYEPDSVEYDVDEISKRIVDRIIGDE